MISKVRILLNYRVVFLLIFLLVPRSELINAQNKGTLQLNSDANITFQHIDGFGASDAWRAQFVGKNWPLDKRNQIADLLFSQEFDKDGNPKGIGLSVWRFNLSTGTAEQGDDSEIGSRENPWRRGECFLNADGTYDWNKQEGQRWFLTAAKERGVEKFLAFTNAPPVHYSANGKGFAPKGVIRINLKPGFMDDYARYMAEVVDHFNKEGIFFDYLSPVNEPQWDWDGHSQEGTPALNEEIYSLTKHLSRELVSRGLKTQIVIAEAGTIGHAALDMSMLGEVSDGRDNQARFFFSKDSPSYIGDLSNVEQTISAHSYHSVWPVDEQVRNRILVNQAIREVNPDLGYWMSEYCILQKNDEIIRGNGRDLSMKTALYVARIIHHDMVLTNAKSWQWWTAITQVDFKDGLVYLDDGSEGKTGKMGGSIESLQHDGAVRDSKLLWVLGNYSRFVRPGMVRIKCELSEEQSPENGVLVSAYKDPMHGNLVYVLVNLSEKSEMVDMGEGEDKDVQTYTTDKNLSMGYSTQPFNRITIPARSVLTVLN
jgi:O-glycosyl hydrolase